MQTRGLEETGIPDIEGPLRAFLDRHGIATRTHRHPPVFTVAEAARLRGDLPGLHAKCLYVRDKKKRRALIVAEESRPVDLKRVANTLGLGRLSFASADNLRDHLGIVPGAVTPFALINAQVDGAAIPPFALILDVRLMTGDVLNFHPLHNAATMSVNHDGFTAFIRACGHIPRIMALQDDTASP